jgi:archaellin
MLTKQKKAVMGIGTLIIFIATILVAAVAAGVIISTAGILQQRALLVGDDARVRLVNAIEVISVVGTGNRTAETMNNLESVVRLDAGSQPLQLRRMGITMITNVWDSSATLAHHKIDNTSFVPTSDITTSAWTPLFDMDGDFKMDYMQLEGPNGSSPYNRIIVNLSEAGISNESIGYDISGSAPVNVRVIDLPIRVNESFFWYVNFSGVAANNTLRVTDPNTLEFTILRWFRNCNFDVLPPEDYWCYNVKLGNDDTVLETGEVIQILVKFKREHSLYTDEDYEMTFYPDRGKLTRLKRQAPSVVTSEKVFLYP